MIDRKTLGAFFVLLLATAPIAAQERRDAGEGGRRARMERARERTAERRQELRERFRQRRDAPRERAKERFDRDGDGKLGPGERERMRRSFQRRRAETGRRAREGRAPRRGLHASERVRRELRRERRGPGRTSRAGPPGPPRDRRRDG